MRRASYNLILIVLLASLIVIATATIAALVHEADAAPAEAYVDAEMRAISTERWHVDLDRARAVAALEGRPIFVFVGRWSSPESRAMARDVLTNPAVRMALAPYVRLRIDLIVDAGEAEKIVMRTGTEINSVPQCLILDATGVLLDRRAGELTAEQVVRLATYGLEQRRWD